MADRILLFLLENGKKWGAFSKGHTDKQLAYSNALSSDCLALMELAFNDCKTAERDEFRTSDITL